MSLSQQFSPLVICDGFHLIYSANYTVHDTKSGISTRNSTFEIRSITFTSDFETCTSILQPLRLTKLQVYVNGSNLLTFSKGDSRRDPEHSGQNVYPMVRRYNIDKLRRIIIADGCIFIRQIAYRYVCIRIRVDTMCKD